MGLMPTLTAWLLALMLLPGQAPSANSVVSGPPERAAAAVQSASGQAPDPLLTYRGDPPPDVPTIVSLRERFTYEVSFGLLTLGTVSVERVDVDPAELSPHVRDLAGLDGQTGGQVGGRNGAGPVPQAEGPDPQAEGADPQDEPTFHRLEMTIRSNPTIPFVGDRRVRYTSLFMVKDGAFHDLRFWRDDLHDGEMERTLVEFHLPSGEARFFERGLAQDTLPITEPATGGSLIFIHSRTYAESGETYLLNIFLENDQAQIWATGDPTPVTRSYKAFEKPIPVYLSSGSTNVDGPFGFSGDFKSWFSADDLRVPVEAWVRIFVGNVKVKLLDYSREDAPGGTEDLVRRTAAAPASTPIPVSLTSSWQPTP